MLLNAEKCQGYSFYCFWVLKGKPTGGGGGVRGGGDGGLKLPPPTPRLGIMISMQKKLLERSTQNNWKTQIKNLELKK